MHLQDYEVNHSIIGAPHDTLPGSNWCMLQVTHYVDDLVLRCALHIVVSEALGGGRSGISGRMVDSVLALLRLSLKFSAESGMRDTKWLIVHVFLWTSWQRCLMMWMWEVMANQLEGYDYEINSKLSRRRIQSIPEIDKVLSQQQNNLLHLTPYLCGWSMRSLQNDRASLSMNFRYFHNLYHSRFGERSAICNPGPTQCNGGSSQHCQRFKNTEVQNQSMHDRKCTGCCPKLFWSRESFLNVVGPRAVDIYLTDNDTLRYCPATEGTLTVSHVWSHGQGGRPDHAGSEGTGFNLCLHRRYADLAVSLGCVSYWMDTPCIPSERELRWECISQITHVFATSAKTLICDRDIMTIDISTHSIASYESLLASLLVCDWGVRAWTLLEAIRGRLGLWVLCQNNMAVSVMDVLKSVHARGRIDIATLFLGRAYLFPPQKHDEDTERELFGELYEPPEKGGMEDGFLSIGEAAAMLSHRHATRDGDDLLIWSLLIGDLEDESPVEMWKRQVGKKIPTGSLISSAQRVQGHRGLGWAPYKPTISQNLHPSAMASKAYPGFDGCGTRDGVITKDGLHALWLTHQFPVDSWLTGPVSVEMEVPVSSRPQIAEIVDFYLCGYKWGILLQAIAVPGPWNTPARYHGALGIVVVVCGSTDKVAWEWKGIYEWDISHPLPAFTFQELLLV